MSMTFLTPEISVLLHLCSNSNKQGLIKQRINSCRVHSSRPALLKVLQRNYQEALVKRLLLLAQAHKRRLLSMFLSPKGHKQGLNRPPLCRLLWLPRPNLCNSSSSKFSNSRFSNSKSTNSRYIEFCTYGWSWVALFTIISSI